MFQMKRVPTPASVGVAREKGKEGLRVRAISTASKIEVTSDSNRTQTPRHI